jgi:hypothetical protein
MSMAAKTAAPAVYSREPGGVFTPAAALHQIIGDLGSATPWAMLAFCLAPRPCANDTATMVGRAVSPGPPARVVSASRGSWASARGNAAAPDMHADSHASITVKKTAPLNYAVRYETAPPAPAIAATLEGRG